MIIALVLAVALVIVGLKFCDAYEEAKKEGYVKRDDEGGL